jgi:hypothetical protein
MNRLQYAADNLANVARNATESRGRVMDADYAKETTELARTQIIAQADLTVPDDRRLAVYETIGLINEQLWMGHFELWSADGMILFRHATLLADDDAEDGGDLSPAQAEILTDAAVEEFERYYPVFQLVLLAGQSPVEALAAALIETAGEA